MKRSQFLQRLGALASLPATLPLLGSSKPLASGRSGSCVLVPSETVGPFPLDLSENDFFFRQEIHEDRIGVPLRQRIRIVGVENCEPMPNVRVNIWHCDRDGDYSGYAQMGTEGETWCRGYQMTDANGECEFVTVFPGWYPGRVTHVHFQVHVSSQYSVVSQWTWPHDDAVAAVEAHPDLYPAGPDPLSPLQDGVFADGFHLQLADLVWDEAAGEYVSFYEATVEGNGTSGVGHQEWSNAHVFSLGQNHPNPVVDWTSLPVTLREPARVTLSLWSTSGQRVHLESLGMRSAGHHTVDIRFSELGIAPGSYLYLVEVETHRGRFTDVRRMTLAR